MKNLLVHFYLYIKFPDTRKPCILFLPHVRLKFTIALFLIKDIFEFASYCSNLLFLLKYIEMKNILTAGYNSQQENNNSQHLRKIGGLNNKIGSKEHAIQKNPDNMLPYHNKQ